MKKWRVKFWLSRQNVQQQNQLKEVVIKVNRISEIRPQLQLHFPQCQITSVVETA
ncbi:hypothetical protein I5M27_05220 [Adhaeribacter sp. BT258]|uniref:Uncharacterized protein n=1 Tax=Adhaeribacter terrigena TaxID=2793070 RepID=A0ABS1BZ68_9BACT|nr:hypothetical protein [Adhaeribacter terrigena]MBK0402374.1 hypothetical protein [Adhaeribacter terrigena]